MEKQNFLLCSLSVNIECLFWYIIWPWWVLLDVMHAVIFVTVYQYIISHICGTIICTKVRGLSPLVCCPSCFFCSHYYSPIWLFCSDRPLLAANACGWLQSRRDCRWSLEHRHAHHQWSRYINCSNWDAESYCEICENFVICCFRVNIWCRRNWLWMVAVPIMNAS